MRGRSKVHRNKSWNNVMQLSEREREREGAQVVRAFVNEGGAKERRNEGIYEY